MADCCLIKKVATVEVYENKNEVRAYGFMAGDRNTPVMEVRFKHLWGESNLSSCKLRWIIVDDVGSLLVGEVPIQSDNTALINLPNELFTGDRRMKVQLTVASCDGERILNLQQFTDLKVINSLAPNEVVEPVYQILINQLYDETQKYLSQLDTLYTSQYGSLENLYIGARASLEQYLITAENGGNAEFLQGYSPAHFQKVENTINDLIASTKYSVGDVVNVLGYYEKGDGAGHPRQKKPVGYNGTDAVIGADGSIWGIVHSGEVRASWFGAMEDGVADDTTILVKAINFCETTKTKLIGGKIKITSPLVARFFELEILEIVNDSSSIFTIGGSSTQPHCPTQKIGRIQHLEIVGAKGQRIDVDRAETIELVAKEGNSNSSIAYSVFNFKFVQTLKMYGAVGGNLYWINENTFNLKRTKYLEIGRKDEAEEYPHNHNVFNTGTFEGEAEIYIKGSHNVLNDVRFEGCTDETLTFAKTSYLNTINCSWASAGSPLTPISASFIDKNYGINNVVFKQLNECRKTSFYYPHNNLGKFGFTLVPEITSDNKYNVGAWSGVPLLETNYIDFSSFFHMFVKIFDINTGGFRIKARYFDSGYTEVLNPNTTAFIRGFSLTPNSLSGANITKAEVFKGVTLDSFNTNFKYVKFYIMAGSVAFKFKDMVYDLYTTKDYIPYTPVPDVKHVVANILSIDTPYHATQMSKLGILDSYHNYLTELHEYEKSQSVQSDSEVMNLNILQPPIIPSEVEAYAKEYNLI